MSGKRLMLGVIVLILGLSIAPVRAASDPATPQATVCTTAPLSIDALQELVLSGTPMSATPWTTVALNSSDVADIATTIEESVACSNANQPLRALAFFTPAYLIARFSGAGADDLGHLTAAVTRDPAPAVAADRLAVVSIGAPKALIDGRVSVLVTTANSAESFTDVLIFANIDNVWRIDETHTATPQPSTPAAKG